jgi:DNA helicase-2/ATP-dependent DNA helicase PcrA
MGRKGWGVFAVPQRCLHLMTMHGAKGKEFDAVAVVDLHDDKVPHFANRDNADGIAESKRLLYVATTRARKFLMYISHESGNVSRFVAECQTLVHI